MRRLPTRTVAALVTLALTIVAGTAFAYWRATGSGTGSAATGTTTAVRLDPATAAGGLVPGGSTAVSLTVSNPNLAPVRLGSLSLDPAQGAGGFAVDAAHAGCATAVLGFTTQTNGGAGYTVPARSGGIDGVLPLSLPGALTMAGNAADACQGARFTVYLTAAP